MTGPQREKKCLSLPAAGAGLQCPPAAPARSAPAPGTSRLLSFAQCCPGEYLFNYYYFFPPPSECYYTPKDVSNAPSGWSPKKGEGFVRASFGFGLLCSPSAI